MNRKPFFRVFELVLLFIALPLFFYFNLLPIPKIVGLLLVTLACGIILWSDRSYNFRQLQYLPHGSSLWKKIAWRGALAAAAVMLLVFVLQPDQLFRFPRQEPAIWLMVMALYPLLSALPQEFIYREFFFQRYDKLFGSRVLLVTASACSFSFLHIIYDNVWAVLLSLIGGFVFAQTYRETRSLYWVSVEHAVYGCIVFTVGIGNYFYEAF